jgi:DNA repair exonuclease SbcCD ATPase subunit/DNA repair exonuclease SbcCD nuclease subunit
MLTSKKKLLEKCSDLGITCSKSLPKEKLIELINQKEKTPIIEIESDYVVKTIYHLADIHIRYLDRHDEYKKVFERLYEKIDDVNSIMVITGDLFHNRDRFVSETLIVFDEFIRKITDKLDLFVIVGNHDCFNHSDRIDTISGIASLTKYKRFHLLKNSGIYKFSNITFGVSSLLDGMGIPPVINDANTKIALFHGIVDGCILDNGTSANDGVNISSFDGYDIVMLGDVHKRQFLNKAKTIAYPGSLIQQNFKEELHHGFLKWDIETCKSEFVKIDNDYSFIDIPVDQHFDVSRINFTQKSRIRLIISSGTSEQEIDETIKQCEKFTEVVSIKKIMKPLEISSETNKLKCDNVDVYEEDIIKSLVPQEKFNDILELHKELLEEVDQDEIFLKSLPWTINKVEFMNIFSYGGDIMNVIDLKTGITGILANNAAGKTNILNTILYGIFGLTRTQNHLNKNIISRYRKSQDLFVKVTIKMDSGEEYFIERTAKTKTRSRIKSSESGQLDVVETLKFYTFDKILNLSTKPETEALVKDTLSILGKDEFVLTNMMSNISYGSTMSIISMTGSQFDDIFNNIFNLNKYANLHKNIKTKTKTLSDSLKTKEIKLELTENNLKEYSCNLENDIANTEEKIMFVENDLKILYNKLENIDASLLKLKATKVSKSRETLLSEITECNEIISEYDGDILDLVKKEDELSVEYTDLLKKYSKDITSGKDPKFNIKKTVSEMMLEIEIENGKRKQLDFDADITNEYITAKRYLANIASDSSLNLEDVKTKLIGLKFDKKCDVYLLPKKDRDGIITELTKKYIDPSLLLKYKKVVEDKETRDKSIKFNIEIDQKINLLKKDIANRKIQDAYSVKSRLKAIGRLLDFVEAYNDKIDLEAEIVLIKDNSTVNELLKTKNELNNDVTKKRTQLKEFEANVAVYRRDLSKSSSLLDAANKLVPEIKEQRSILEIYKLYTEVTHQKNLPKKLISSVIKNITDDANVLIYECTGLLCEIQENDKWEVVVIKGDMVLGPEHCSGYERFIINTSLKISFDKYKQLSSIKLFMIDETIDCVSESNLDQIDTLLECLQKHYEKVILISHNEDLKKKINNRIEILVENKISSLI